MQASKRQLFAVPLLVTQNMEYVRSVTVETLQLVMRLKLAKQLESSLLSLLENQVHSLQCVLSTQAELLETILLKVYRVFKSCLKREILKVKLSLQKSMEKFKKLRSEEHTSEL